MVYLPCSERFRTQPAIQKLKIINLRENVLPYQHEGSDFFTYEFTLTREIMGVNIISIMFFIASLVRSLLSHCFTLDLDLCISVDSNHVVEPVHVSYERINDLYSNLDICNCFKLDSNSPFWCNQQWTNGTLPAQPHMRLLNCQSPSWI